MSLEQMTGYIAMYLASNWEVSGGCQRDEMRQMIRVWPGLTATPCATPARHNASSHRNGWLVLRRRDEEPDESTAITWLKGGCKKMGQTISSAEVVGFPHQFPSSHRRSPQMLPFRGTLNLLVAWNTSSSSLRSKSSKLVKGWIVRDMDIDT